MTLKRPNIGRRAFLIGGTAAIAAGTTALVRLRKPQGNVQLPARPLDPSAGIRLTAARAQVPLLGPGTVPVNVWAYNGQVPGPELRIRQGKKLRVLLDNRLSEDTTIHWHGVRVPNPMDGVPKMTQPPVAPRTTYDYEFVVPDAGTFLYHPHAHSSEQIGRGLYGALIVEEPDPPAVDRELVWLLDDWRIDNGQIAGGFGNGMDALMNGRVGNTVTINGRVPQPVAVRPNERIRLRLLNIANARIFGLHFGGLRPVVIAIDGQPAPPRLADGPILLGPGMRTDLILDMTGKPGDRVQITDNFYNGLEYQLTSFTYASSPVRQTPLSTPIDLRPNPIAEPNLDGAEHHEMVFGGGMMSGMGGGMMGGGGMGWTVNGLVRTDDPSDALFTIPRGRTAVFDLRNETAWWHPIHLHGHSFRVISRNGTSTARKDRQDTILIPPQETAEIAFVADNPGDWMVHCHILEHQEAGMMATFRVS